MQEPMSLEINSIPEGKIVCFITGKLRKDTPEEQVRQSIARDLLINYGYPQEDIEIEFLVPIGSSKRRVDIAVFHHNAPHKPEHIYIIVECKKADTKPSDRLDGIGQLKSYLAASASVRYGLWIGAERHVIERIPDTAQPFVDATDLPQYGANAPKAPLHDELIPADEELKAVFHRCHNYIHGNQGIQKEAAFQEFLKLIFCKVWDEEHTIGEGMRFFIDNKERRTKEGQEKVRQVVQSLFQEVCQAYRYIFPQNEEIKLEDRVLAYIVSEMQKFSLEATRTDVKGDAYEELVGSNLRGDRGEFFTPRNVCTLAARMVLETYPKERRRSIHIIDPACGTGGFLVATMNHWRKDIEQQMRMKYKEKETIVQYETNKQLKEFAHKYLVGIDFNPVLVRAAQMNMVMQGDGSTNVYHANSLVHPDHWSDTYPNNVRQRVMLENFDVVLTNPPFGSFIPIDDPHILEQFDIARAGTQNQTLRNSMPPEQLFIERCLQLLKPGGRMAIVLPDSILSNPGLVWIRRWIMRETQIIASVDLPQVTFEPYTGTQTSILVLRKKTVAEKASEEKYGPAVYDVFMTTPQQVGHDKRGFPVYRRTEEGDVITLQYDRSTVRRNISGEYERVSRVRIERVIHDDLYEVYCQFSEWLNEEGKNRMKLINDNSEGSA